MKVPFVDLKVLHDPLRASFVQAFEAILEASHFILGDEVAAFEKEFASYQKVPYCVGVGNGTDALALMVEAMGIERGQGVVTVPHTFSASAEAVRMAGGAPVFVDVEPVGFTMDPQKLEDRLAGNGPKGKKRPKIVAALPVHLYGRLADMGSILEIAARHSIRVLEDGCQAHGAERAGKRAGGFGAAAAFSFYPSKNLGALGDGGAVATTDPEIDARVRALRDYGRRVGEKYLHDTAGRNSRLDEMQASFLRIKLRGLEAGNRLRVRAASLYQDWLSGIEEVRLPHPGTEPGDHVFHLYVIRVPRTKRDPMMAYLAEKGVGTGIHYPIPLHLQPSYRELGYGAGDFPVSEAMAAEIVSLPVFPGITEEQQSHVADAIRSFFERRL